MTVVIIGASADRSKFGNKSLRAHRDSGWTVIPVNPRGGEIEGIAAVRSLSEIPGPVDRVSLYVPPERGVGLLAEIARLSPREFFVNPGAESDELVRRSKELGVDPLLACSIVDLGRSPAQYSA